MSAPQTNMNNEESTLYPPEEFLFPFKPYPIQQDFMRELYITLENRGLAVFESPTGTGKSMSIICGALQWLFDSERRKKENLTNAIHQLNSSLCNNVSKSDDWLNDQYEACKNRDKKFECEKQLLKIKEMEDKIKDLKKKTKENKLNSKATKSNVLGAVKKHKNKESDSNEVKIKVDEEDDIILSEDGLPQTDASEELETTEEEDQYSCPKIFICSRTHSQLSQIAGEIQKSPFRELGVRVVPLASRQNLCVNDDVLSLKQLSLINETCQDLRSRKSCKATKTSNDGRKIKKLKTSAGCPYTNADRMELLRGECLTQVLDIEELSGIGRDLGACPYYTVRNSVRDAHVVLVPYNTLLHRSTREASKIDLKDSIVVVDEAHNLLDTLGNIHSAMVTGMQLCHGHSILVQYRDRFRDRFTPLNLLHLNQMIFVVQKLMLKVSPKVKPAEPTTVDKLNDFILSTETDNINLYTLLDFAKRSLIANKIRGYIYKFEPTVVIPEKKKQDGGVSSFLKNIKNKGAPAANPAPTQEPEKVNGNPLPSILSFFEALTNHAEDGRVFCHVGATPSDSYIKFFLLNPAAHFKDIVNEARAVILAGGTMQPFSEFTDQLYLLAGAPKSRIKTFACGHVVPPSNILPITVSQGPGGRQLDFSYSQRNAPELLDDLGRLLVNVCNVVPAGMVVFYPSYEYEAKVFKYFKEKGFIDKMAAKKKILREPKLSSKVEKVLSQYSEAASKGALLFSVVGGKLSEGLNFSDDLGRCVIVVGLPYPNKTSPELKEKIAYLTEKVGKNAGQIYYENLCMKAVNQSIGRAVRHLNDYASVLLLDHRYARPRTIEALPQWIKKSLRSENQFGPVIAHLAKFFASKKLAK